jgi:excisionase family DNA binding protein
MTEYLSIKLAAQRLGVSVDTVRQWERAGRLKAERTEGGHRRFRAVEVERLIAKRGGARRDAAASPTPRPDSEGRPPRSSRNPFANDSPKYWQDRAREARARTEVIKSHAAARDLLAAREAEWTRAGEAAEAGRRREEHQRQLEALKEFGRSCAAVVLPPDWRAQVADDIEDFVTPERFPPTLLAAEARAFIEGRVQAIVRRYHEQRAEEETMQKQERERALQQAQLEGLVESGVENAHRSTSSWDPLERARVRREVEEQLREEVTADWTEEEVRALVAEILSEWQADDEEDGEDEEFDDEVDEFTDDDDEGDE